MGIITIKGSATDLTVLEQLTPADLFAPQGTEPVYEAIKQEIAGFVADISTEDGRKEVASLAYKIAQSKNFLDKVGKIFNSDLKEKTKAVDSERKVIWDKLEALQKEVRAPLDAYEAAEEKRVQDHKDAVAELEKLHIFMSTNIENIDKAISRATELKQRNWEEFSDMVAPIFEQQWSALNGLKATAEQAEKDRLELESLRAKQAEQDAKDAETARLKAVEEERAKIQKEAAEKATRDAEAAIQAEKDKAAKAAEEAARVLKESEAKAAREKADAEDRAKKAEEARIAAEAKSKLEADAAVQREKDRAAAEQKRLDDEAKQRENNRQHHAKINNEIMAAIQKWIDLTPPDSLAKILTVTLAEGKIPHTKIFY